jgi:hypothetical protein
MDLPGINKILISFDKWKSIFKNRGFASQALKAPPTKEAIAAFEKTVRSLQAKGLLIPLDPQNALQAFLQHHAEMSSISAKYIYNFYIDDAALQKLSLFVFSDDQSLKIHKICYTENFNYQAFIHEHAPSGIPLSQVQDISGWLHNHGSTSPHVLNQDTLEKKLESLMKSCPHGAYVLHTSNKALTLSRLCPRGRIEHLIVNLQKQIGCYTIEQEGIETAATRTQFKRRLAQMGTPLRLINR